MDSKQRVALAAEMPTYDGNEACAGPAQSKQSELCQLSGHSQHAASMNSKQKVAVAAGMPVYDSNDACAGPVQSRQP